MPTVYDPDGRAWAVRRRISPRTPRDADVFEWVDVFGDAAPIQQQGRDVGLRAGLLAAAAITVAVVVAPRALAQVAPLLALVLLTVVLALGRALLGVPTVIEAWVQAPAPVPTEPAGSSHIVVRARGWGAGMRAERDVCAALREGYAFTPDS